VSEPYAVPLGGEWRALVFDSASVGNAPIAPDGALFRTYREQMQRLLLSSDSSAWFLSHHPPLAFAANPSRPLSPYPGNAGLLAVLRSLNGEAYFPPHVKLLVAGHNHVFEAVSFASGHPSQLVAGHGGDTLDEPLPSPLPPDLAPAPGTTIATLVSSNRFRLPRRRSQRGWVVGARVRRRRRDARDLRDRRPRDALRIALTWAAAWSSSPTTARRRSSTRSAARRRRCASRCSC
jgi:hypothetical protein